MDRIRLSRGEITLVTGSRTVRVGTYRRGELGYEVELGWPMPGQVMGCGRLKEVARMVRFPSCGVHRLH